MGIKLPGVTGSAASDIKTSRNIFGKGDPPAPPDYMRLAQQQTSLNNTNQYGPYGSITYQSSVDPKTGLTRWSQNTNLSPEQQQLMDTYGEMQSGLLDNIQDQFSTPFNLDSAQDIADSTYSSYTSRLDPQWNQRQQQLETQLANQGIGRGTEAYTNAMRDFGTGRNDAYQQAMTNSYQMMPQALAMEQAVRNQPLSELSAIRGALSPTLPTQGPGGAQTDLLGAGQAGYSANLGAHNAQTAQQSGLMNSGLMALAAYMYSDVRLKTNIQRIGTHPEYGIGIYSYNKFGAPEIGVIAQELESVRPDAVITHSNGFKMVDYNKV